MNKKLYSTINLIILLVCFFGANYIFVELKQYFVSFHCLPSLVTTSIKLGLLSTLVISIIVYFKYKKPLLLVPSYFLVMLSILSIFAPECIK